MFHLSTDRPELLALKQRCLRIPAKEQRYIGLEFLAPPVGIVGSAKMLVFVNNEEDKNEECMEITVAYADVAPQEK